MCDATECLNKEADLMIQVNETDEGLQAAQQLLILRRQRWAITAAGVDCKGECKEKA